MGRLLHKTVEEYVWLYTNTFDELALMMFNALTTSLSH